MYGIPPLAPELLIVCFLGAIGAALLYMHKRHPHHVYTIWLVFSAFLLVFFALGIVAHKKDATLLEICGTYKNTCETVMDALTNLEHELIFAGVLAAVTILPQVLAYVLSSITGSAIAPQYVWAIQQTATWSFIKFSAGLGGILLAQPLANLATLGYVVLMDDVVAGIYFVGLAFFYAFINLAVGDWWKSYYARNFEGDALKQRHVRMLLRVHAWCTRNVPKKPPLSLDRRILIELLKSDAVYDYVTHHGAASPKTTLYGLAAIASSVRASHGNFRAVLPAPSEGSTTTGTPEPMNSP